MSPAGGDAGTRIDEDSPVMSDAQSEPRPGPGIGEGVIGQIMDSRGRPVAGASVRPRSLDDSSPAIPEIAIVSDSDGRYTWSLFPGIYEISVSAEGY